MDYRCYYHHEAYLFETVGPRFARHGKLSAFDFFCIVIWKANRAKSRVAKRLLDRGYEDLEKAVQALAADLVGQSSAKGRLRCLIERWGLRLPMASAILTVLYPEEFTLYDVRVREQVGDFRDLDNLADFENLWRRYQEFKGAVERTAPSELSLRDKDRWLWGKSFFDQLQSDISKRFGTQQAATT